MSLPSYHEELSNLIELIRAEQQEDRRQYEELVLKRPMSERRAQGITWFPLAIRESFYGTGERLILELERTTHTDVPHQFQFGQLAALFSMAGDEPETQRIGGVVTSVRRNNLRLTLFVDELPEWVDKGKLGLDLLFDESTYKEMEKALQFVIKARNCREAELRDVLLGHREASFRAIEEVNAPQLNASQKQALQLVKAAEDVAIIHGPPGTGKTTTMVAAINEVLKEEEQVLVCAASNAAVDLLTEKLSRSGLKVVRIGHPSRISEEMLSYSLDQQVLDHPEYKNIKEYKKRAAEFKNMAGKYKRHFGKEERAQRKAIMDEARKLQAEAEKIESYIVTDLLEKAQVITSTLSGAGNYVLKEKRFSTVFIDEAAQALEPACWIPILKAERVVMAGDHCQLPPTVKSSDAMRGGLGITLFEKTIARQKADVMLATQYRMHPVIMNFSSRQFYHGKLQAYEALVNNTFKELSIFDFIDTAGCGYNEAQEKGSTSTVNEEEARLLIRLLKKDIQQLQSENKPVSIGVISPYKGQVRFIDELLVQSGLYEQKGIQISVNSVDAFQGQERDVIYISLVRSNDKGEIGFLGDIRRMNVAMTRARKRLVMTGDTATFGAHPFYKALLQYTEEVNAWKSAWEFTED